MEDTISQAWFYYMEENNQVSREEIREKGVTVTREMYKRFGGLKS